MSPANGDNLGRGQKKGLVPTGHEPPATRSASGLPRAKAGQNSADGLEHDEHIQPEGEVLDVVKIVFDLDASIIGIGGITVYHLSPAADPGPHDMTVHVEGDLPLELIDEGALLRSRPYQTHVPFEDVEELRQLVNAQLANHLAHPGDAHVTILSELCTGLLRILAHAAELVNAKILVALPHPVLQEHHRARALQLDEDRRHQHQGREERDRDQRGQNVQPPLDKGIDGRRQEGAELVLVEMVDLHSSGQSLADLLDVINGNVSQGAAREETLPLPR